MAMIHLMLGLPLVGVKPILVATHPDPSYRKLFERLREKGVKLVLSGRRFKGTLFWIWLFFAVLRNIRKFRVNLVHCHGTKESVVVGLMAKILRRKVVYTVEGDPILEIMFSPRRYTLFERIALTICWRLGLKLADAVVGCSKWMAEHLKKYGVKAFFIHNAIDYERFSSTGLIQGSVENETVVSIARFEHVKGLDTLIRAAARLIEKYPNMLFILVGGGSLKDELQGLVKALGLEGKVILLDYTPEVDQILARASLVVIPSLYEPFGMAAAEALAAGKTVVASRTGGLREIVIDGLNGLLFTPGDYEDLARKMLKILEDGELRRRLVEAARNSAIRFSPEKISKQYLKLYQTILSVNRV